MPISLDEFENASEKVLKIGEETNGEKVVTFLSRNYDKAFNRKEIAEATGIKKGSIGVTLSRLEGKGLVRHKGNYWALAKDHKIATLTSEASGTKTANDTLGTENKTEWIDRED